MLWCSPSHQIQIAITTRTKQETFLTSIANPFRLCLGVWRGREERILERKKGTSGRNGRH